MSYILEALKKSDQQRQRGTTPTLQAAQITVAAPKQTLLVTYGLFAVVLLGTGIMIGWLQPWQVEQPIPAAEPDAANPPIPYSRQAAPAPSPAPLEMAGMTAREMPQSTSMPGVQYAPGLAAVNPDIPASAVNGVHGAAAPVAENPARPADVAQEQRAMPIAELPLPIQQEIPPMTVQLHAYSSNASERLVSINSTMLREGGSLTPDIRLEQITADGMIFSYKGYRFQHGIR